MCSFPPSLFAHTDHHLFFRNQAKYQHTTPIASNTSVTSACVPNPLKNYNTRLIVCQLQTAKLYVDIAKKTHRLE